MASSTKSLKEAAPAMQKTSVIHKKWDLAGCARMQTFIFLLKVGSKVYQSMCCDSQTALPADVHERATTSPETKKVSVQSLSQPNAGPHLAKTIHDKLCQLDKTKV